METAKGRFGAGVGLLVVAAVFWSLNGAFIKSIHDGGAGPGGITIAFYRSLFAGLCLLPLARGKWKTLSASGAGPRWRVRPAALCCMVFFTAMTLCFVVANTKTEAANAIILQYTSTFWIYLLSPWLLGERPHAGDARLLGLALAGIAVIFAGNAHGDALGLTIALASGLFFGLLTMMIRRLRDSDPGVVTVFNNLGSALLLFPVCALWGEFMISRRSVVLLLLMGVVQFGLPYYAYSLGLARVPAHQAALITMLEPVLVPVWTYLAVGESVPPTTLIGGSVILVALVLFFRAARRRSFSGEASA